VTNTDNTLDTKQQLLNGANEGAQQLSSVLQQDFGNRSVTVTVAAGTRIGLLFVSSVFDPNAQQNQQGQYPGQAQNPYQQQLQNAAGGYAGGYVGQAVNAYNAYNSYANGGNNGYGQQQQYYNNQQYNQQQQQQYIQTPQLRSNFR